MKFEVRPARPDDVPAIGEVHAASWEAVYAPLFAPAFAEAGVRDRRERQRALDGLVAALADGRLLAFSYTIPSAEREGFLEILSFYGHPDGWGSGVASALMAGTVAGVERVHLWTLRNTEQSRRFYRKCGFVETGASRTRDFGDGQPLAQVEYLLVRK
ncbi:L-amino acid N-acyltransferase YncA [Actinokineospora baliensis]|uniref:GNAT family N-acetyltransferase n=1 Tax=Actinokineospora baliensis TaxID=547056 RepID=UPI00195741A2|nr:GNAT family N-acetyltransferase [Actinokineospora baliensis]MBM7773671.1 L-amino acid N-acyltransferase YncA [Actinokineospora baliensis]